jgi:glycosyltransferase involved in cell wall biosynthesis
LKEFSVVCPFFNEEAIIGESVAGMLAQIKALDRDCELVIVDDGSTDQSLSIVRQIADHDSTLRIVHYDTNRGRGHAIRAGVGAAKGALVVTTEIDSSWGPQIVDQLFKAFEENPGVDIVIASPNLNGGGYQNVPFRRVLLSRLGNRLIRAMLGSEITMFTGMTRAYRRSVFATLPLNENGKELHLEIVNKALVLDFRVSEIPATITWPTVKRGDNKKERKSSSNIPRLIKSHLLFSAGVNPFRFLFPTAILLETVALSFMSVAIYRLFTPLQASNFALVGFNTGLFGFVLFGIGMLAHQNQSVMQELWRNRHHELVEKFAESEERG